MAHKSSSSTKAPRRASSFTRRTVLKSSLAAGVVTVTGCAAPATKSPREPGQLRAGLRDGSRTDSLDPATFENAFTTLTGYAYRNHLTEVSNTGNLIPELAESWEASSDAAIWTFKLRQGVEFHNGKTLDASDIVASIDHHRGKENKSPVKPILAQVESIKADGKHTVVVKLGVGIADFPTTR